MTILTTLGTAMSVASIALFVPNAAVPAYNFAIDQFQVEDYARQRDCLALNIYHEAKGESELGQRAVAYVTLNRANDERYPDNVCDVVYQAQIGSDGEPKRNKCQFSWYCDGRSDEPTDKEAYAEAMFVASVVINTYGYSFDPTLGATMYHAESVNPGWSSSFEETTEIENHIFYR